MVDKAKAGKVRVVVRVRPLLPRERAAQHTTSLLRVADDSVGVVVRSATEEYESSNGGAKQHCESEFRFDAVFDGSASQGDFFKGAQISAMVQAVASGYNATIFGGYCAAPVALS